MSIVVLSFEHAGAYVDGQQGGLRLQERQRTRDERQEAVVNLSVSQRVRTQNSGNFGSR
jgi:hypothetical protein